MKISVIKERYAGEKRIAICPEVVKKIVGLGINLCVEKGIGSHLHIEDQEFVRAGGHISAVPLEILADTDILFKVKFSSNSLNNDLNELNLLPERAVIVGMLEPEQNQQIVEHLAKRNITSFALEFIPNIIRAHPLNCVASQTGLAGYRALITAIYEIEKVASMMITPAGTIVPLKVLIMGARAAGLQAIALAKRLGAVVTVFDQENMREQAESLQVNFISTLNDIKAYDIIICTFNLVSREAITLITEDMVSEMKSGSVIVDFTVKDKGNCELTRSEQTINYSGIKIIGCRYILDKMLYDASKLYAYNLLNFLLLIYDQDSQSIKINYEDEIIKNTLLTYNGQIVNKYLRQIYYG